MMAGYHLIRRMLTGTALLAVALSALLPMGMLPKMAGMCGRDLCNCPVTVQTDTKKSCCAKKKAESPCCARKAAAARVLTFSDSVIAPADAPGIAFQVVFSGICLPQPPPLLAGGEAETHSGAGHEFALKEAILDTFLPPPRSALI